MEWNRGQNQINKYTIMLAEKFIRVFCGILTKNPNEDYGQPNITWYLRGNIQDNKQRKLTSSVNAKTLGFP